MKIDYRPNGSEGLVYLENEAGLAVTLSPLGAGIRDIFLNGKPMLYRPSDDQLYLAHNGGYYGKSIGPIAGRVKEGKLSYDGITATLPQNERGNCLHSATLCYAFELFKTEVEDAENGVNVVFTLFKEKIPGVYPSDVTLTVHYHLHEKEPILTLRYVAMLSDLAPLNLTNHSYFNLGGDENVLDHVLTVKSSYAETYDEALIPLGLKEVTPTLDFRKGKAIGQNIKNPEIYETTNRGYDHFFKFDKVKDGEPNLTVESSRFKLELRTDCPGVVIYTEGYPHEDRLMNNGKMETYGGALTLETCELQHQEEQLLEGRKVFKRRTQFTFIDKEED